jgi:hypothetical protein
MIRMCIKVFGDDRTGIFKNFRAIPTVFINCLRVGKMIYENLSHSYDDFGIRGR